MKTILILTDLSGNAAQAAKTAVMLGGALNTNLLLYNTQSVLPVSSYYADYAGGPWVIDDFTKSENESNEKMQHLSECLQALIAKMNPQLRKPVVHYEVGEGSLAENISTVVDQKNIAMIVMGASSDAAFEHILNGSDSHAIIDHARCPILVVPQYADLKNFKKVIFATDFGEADIKGIHYLFEIGNLLNLQIEIVHISLYGEKDSSVIEKKQEFLKQVSRLRYANVMFNDVKGRNIVGSLNDLCEEENADVLALVHYQHNFLKRLLGHSTTKDALLNQNIPLLIFPSKMEKSFVV